MRITEKYKLLPFSSGGMGSWSTNIFAELLHYNVLQGCSGQSVIFDFENMVTYTMISLGYLALKWALVTDIWYSCIKLLVQSSISV